MNRCPACDVVVVDTHECRSEWDEPDFGVNGFEVTTCTVGAGGAMSVSVKGGTDTSAITAVLAMGEGDSWFAGMDDGSSS